MASASLGDVHNGYTRELCHNLCDATIGCVGFQYKGGTGQCSLNEGTRCFNGTSNDNGENSNWDYYNIEDCTYTGTISS